MRATSLLRTILFLGVLVASACKGKPPPSEPTDVAETPEAGDQAQAESMLDTAQEEARLEEEYSATMFDRHYKTARRLRDGLLLPDALAEVEKALGYDPASEPALTLRAEIMRLLGDRAGETATYAEDQYEGFRVKRVEQKLTVRRKLEEAKGAAEVQEFTEARRAYEQASFIVTSAKLSPLGGDPELNELGSQAERGLRELEQAEAQAQAEQQRRDTEDALRLVARAEEDALMQDRDRRARLLSSAIDHFNREEFELAETLGQQVLDEEPDNRVARDVVSNARRARHTKVGERYLRDLKASFRRWQVDIEESKIPQSALLEWPSQTFWDRITTVRARRDELSGGGREFSPEEQNVFNLLQSKMIDLDFEETGFPQVVDYLSASSAINFVIDARAKDDLDAVALSIVADRVTVADALDMIMLQASSEGEVVFEVVGNVVRFIKKEHRKSEMILHIHPVADLTLGLVDFIPPQITEVGVDEDSETPLFGGQGEEAPQPYGTIEELMELVRSAVSPPTWEEGGTLNNQGKNLVVFAPPRVQRMVANFLNDLRSFAGIIITVESRFLTISDMFLRDVGVDFRGLGGTNGGPLAVLDDITSGFDDNASAALDNSGAGLDAGGSATAPSSGFFFNDGSDGDFRGRTENIFSNPLGKVLSALGGGSFQVTYLDDFALSAVIRATEKSAAIREMTAPSVTVFNTQRANLSSVTQISYIQDFDVEVAQTSFIADPVIGVLQEGIVLDVRPTVSNDRQYITLDMRPTVTDVVTPISTFTTLLGAAIATTSSQNPVTIQLPQLDIRQAESTVRIPDGGSILMGGLKTISIEDKKSTTPVLGNIPILGFLFKRQGKSDEAEHLMIVVTATITDLQEEAERLQ
jgi:general secretion pathway protein D